MGASKPFHSKTQWDKKGWMRKATNCCTCVHDNQPLYPDIVEAYFALDTLHHSGAVVWFHSVFWLKNLNLRLDEG